MMQTCKACTENSNISLFTLHWCKKAPCPFHALGMLFCCSIVTRNQNHILLRRSVQVQTLINVSAMKLSPYLCLLEVTQGKSWYWIIFLWLVVLVAHSLQPAKTGRSLYATLLASGYSSHNPHFWAVWDWGWTVLSLEVALSIFPLEHKSCTPYLNSFCAFFSSSAQVLMLLSLLLKQG